MTSKRHGTLPDVANVAAVEEVEHPDKQPIEMRAFFA
jgi:hypothetical protein